MTRRGCVLSFAVLAIVGLMAAEEPSIRITDPKEGATVPYQPFVRGEVTGKVASVWVVIHPIATDDYWVQPAVGEIRNGKWSTQVYFGRPGTVDVGKEFEVRAVADAEAKLEEGTALKSWPRARATSSVLRVKRGA